MRTTDITTELGWTYRQLDWLTRNGVLHQNNLNRGSGNTRTWDPETVDRLRIARALLDAAPGLTLPIVARAVMSGPVPARSGLVILDPAGDVHYLPNLHVLADPGGVIAAFDLDASLIAA